jgi:hypothetical protein
MKASFSQWIISYLAWGDKAKYTDNLFQQRKITAIRGSSIYTQTIITEGVENGEDVDRGIAPAPMKKTIRPIYANTLQSLLMLSTFAGGC